MLTINSNEKNNIDKLLNQLNVDFNTIEFICKDGFFYDAKSKEPIDHLLTYILLNYPNTSNINLEAWIGKINISVREHGVVKNLNLNISATTDYKFATIDNLKFSTEIFKDQIEAIRNKKTADFIEHVSIPLFGIYRMRSGILNNLADIRLLRTHQKNGRNYSILYIESTPYYKMNILTDDFHLNNNKANLPKTISEKIKLYQNTMNELYKYLNNGMDSLQGDFTDIKLNFNEDDNLDVDVLTHFPTERWSLDKKIIPYITRHVDIFYDSVFTTFLNKVLNITAENNLNGSFKSPDDLSDCLKTFEIVNY